MKSLLLITLLCFSLSLHSQYYYNDIVGTMETSKQMQTFVSNKVRMVVATGFDHNGVKATDFSEVQEIKENGKALKFSSRTNNNYGSYYSRFDPTGKLLSISDSSTAVQSVTSYWYDAAGRITKVENTIRDTANDFNQTEVHQYYYRSDGKPDRMWRTINNSDSLEVRFIPDEDGNIGEEKTFRRGVENGTVYY